jgi:hypothetical protein
LVSAHVVKIPPERTASEVGDRPNRERSERPSVSHPGAYELLLSHSHASEASAWAWSDLKNQSSSDSVVYLITLTETAFSKGAFCFKSFTGCFVAKKSSLHDAQHAVVAAEGPGGLKENNRMYNGRRPARLYLPRSAPLSSPNARACGCLLPWSSSLSRPRSPPAWITRCHRSRGTPSRTPLPSVNRPR